MCEMYLQNGKHVEYKNTKLDDSSIENHYYSSLNYIETGSISRKNDFENLMYILMQFYHDSLKYAGITDLTDDVSIMSELKLQKTVGSVIDMKKAFVSKDSDSIFIKSLQKIKEHDHFKGIGVVFNAVNDDFINWKMYDVAPSARI